MAMMCESEEEYSEELIGQVEFCLGDSNLRVDDFLRNQIVESSDGMISLELICLYHPIRKWLGLGDGLSDDLIKHVVKGVAKYLRKSTSLRISDDGMKIGRIKVVPNYEGPTYDECTVAVSPFSLDVNAMKVASFFSNHAEVRSVKMPLDVANKQLFSGTALVQFTTKKDALKILDGDFNFNGVALDVTSKKEFDKKMAMQVEDTKSQSGSFGLEYRKDVMVAFKLKKTTEEVGDNKPMEKDEDMEEIKIDDITLSAADLQISFQKFGNVKSVNFEIGSESGYIEFEDAEASQKARATAVLADEGGVVVKNYVAILDSDTGEAGTEYGDKDNSRSGMHKRGRENEPNIGPCKVPKQ